MWRRYLISMLAGAVAPVLGFAAILLALERWRPASLPPPPLLNEASFDEKMLSLRRKERAPELLAVGSSMTARNLDLAAFVDGALEPERAFNGAVMNLSVNQTAYLTRFYLDHFPSVRRLLVQVAPFDFRDCTRRPDAFFDRSDAERLAFSDAPLVLFYFLHFDPIGVLRRALGIAKQRKPGGGLYMDDYGFFPTTLSPKQARLRGLRYEVGPLDESCFVALRRLADLAASRGVRLTVVVNPVNPRFYDEPGAREFIAGFAAHLEETLKGGPTRIVDLTGARGLSPDDFYDAYHLQRPAATQVSHTLGRMVGPES